MSKVDGQQPPDTGGGDSMLYDDTGGWGVDSGPLYIYSICIHSFNSTLFHYMYYTHILLFLYDIVKDKNTK